MIAGPNGAGKSTLSQTILAPFSLTAFDWDFEFHTRWRRFSLDPSVSEGVSNTTNEFFEALVDQSLDDASDFAFETNFHTSEVIELCDRFRRAGFEIRLYFLWLPHSQLAKERVAKRVARGGHPVSNSTIEERFAKGLRLLDGHWHEFEGLVILNAGLGFRNEVMMIVERGKILESFVSAEELKATLPGLAAKLS